MSLTVIRNYACLTHARAPQAAYTLILSTNARLCCRLQECYKGPKFSFVSDDDTFTLIIKNPDTSDTGRYNCVVRECNDLTCKGYLEVEREYILLFRI